MIVGSYVKRYIGTRVKSVSDIDSIYHQIPAMVLREADREEYVNQCVSEGLTRHEAERHADAAVAFYEVSID